jgi:hypothetical protein
MAPTPGRDVELPLSHSKIDKPDIGALNTVSMWGRFFDTRPSVRVSEL